MFDSLGRHLGADYSQWSDVSRTPAGLYGAPPPLTQDTRRETDGC